MTPNTISTIGKLGYWLGIAQGSVPVEEDALAAAREQASPGAVVAAVGEITTATLNDLANLGQLPEIPEDRQALASQIGAAALAMVTEHTTARVEFHERAVAIAKEMPDVWRVEQWVAGPDADGVYTPPLILSTMVSCKPDGTGWTDVDQEHIDALADKDAYAERAWQALNPDAMAAAQQLAAVGRVVERLNPGTDTFTVDGKTMTADAVISAAARLAA